MLVIPLQRAKLNLILSQPSKSHAPVASSAQINIWLCSTRHVLFAGTLIRRVDIGLGVDQGATAPGAE